LKRIARLNRVIAASQRRRRLGRPPRKLARTLASHAPHSLTAARALHVK